MDKRHRYKLDLKNFSTFKAPDNIWDGIQEELNADASKSRYSIKIKGLKEYSAPDRVWQQLENKLNLNDRRIIQLKSTRLKYAAAILILVGFGGYALFNSFFTNSINYSKEPLIAEIQLEANNADDDALFASLQEFIENSKIHFSNSDVEKLNGELKELEIARNEIREIVGIFNTEPELIRQLKTIELERTRISNQIISILNEV